ncbi:hypothetical protein [Comamonas sp. JC664]|uniref:hypothetical protein n=1 Tax=Comamonas sp. JC664 TaxID=2801917 RepID=UPI00360770C1
MLVRALTPAQAQVLAAVAGRHRFGRHIGSACTSAFLSVGERGRDNLRDQRQLGGRLLGRAFELQRLA